MYASPVLYWRDTDQSSHLLLVFRKHFQTPTMSTHFQDGTKEEGKYKNNVLITSNKKKHMFLIRSAKFRERIEAAVAAAQKAAKLASQKEDIAKSRWAINWKWLKYGKHQNPR